MPDLPYVDIGGVRYYSAPNRPLIEGYNAAGTKQFEVGGKGETFKGYIPLDLFSARIILSNDFADETIVSTGGSEKASGGILAVDGVTASLNRVNGATDKAARVILQANESIELQVPTIALPPDLDTGKDMTVHVLGEMAGTTDDAGIDVQVFFGKGDTECGGITTPDFDNGSLVEGITTIAHADIPSAPSIMNIALVPEAHTTDAMWLYAAWIEYTRS